jgi:hypothetical protein
MRQVVSTLVVCLLTANLATAGQINKPTNKKGQPKAASSSAVATKLSNLEQALEAQQKQIQQLMDQVQSRDAQIEQMQQKMNQVETNVGQAQHEASDALAANSKQEANVTAVRSDVEDLKGTTTGAVVALQDSQKKLEELGSPLALHFKGITITPGGFLAAETVWRQRGIAGDVNTPFNAVPFPGSSQSSLSEFFASGRQSRVSMLAEGKLKSARVAGYVEADFLSAGTTSNNNQSNSYTLRQRQLWAQAALHGWTFTGGQMWSLVTETKKGVDNRTEALPMTIDAQYTVGFTWARQFGFRIAKNFDNKLWLAAAIESPQTTFAAHGNAANFVLGTTGNAGGLYDPLANYSFNAAPDVVLKAAFEPGFGHYEVFGIVSQFRDRIFPCAEASESFPCGAITTPSTDGAFNDLKTGGGVGANARATFFKHLDLGAHFLGGNGVGRYGTAGLPDATVHSNGALALLRSYQGLGTIEWHHPKYDIYGNAGVEYVDRHWNIDPISGKPVGYGSTLFNNSGCYSETLPGANGFTPGPLSNCNGDTRNVIEGTFGFWYRLYDGPKGKVQFGPQYSYVTRNTWAGTGGTPHAVDNMVFTSFRYYLP